MATCYFLIGIPGSGKSTFALTLGCKVVCPDDIRVKRHAHSVQAFAIAQEEIVDTLKRGEHVVFDATNTIAKWRKQNIETAKQYADKVVCILMNTTTSECIRRHTLRQQQGVRTSLPINVIHRMARQLADNQPTLEEGFDEIVLASEFRKQLL